MISGNNQPREGVAEGVPVVVGETTRYRLKIYQSPEKAVYKVVREDGSPYQGTAGTNFAPNYLAGWNSSATLDSSGTGKQDLKHPGLWRFGVMFRDSITPYYPTSPPYFRGNGWVAVSPNLKDQPPPVFTASRIEPGSAVISVVDEKGRPVQATVQIWSYESMLASGTTGPDGVIRFAGLYDGSQVGTLSDNFYAQVFAAGFTTGSVDLGEENEPWPPLDALRTRTVFVEAKSEQERLPLVLNREADITVKPVRGRYIYGTIRSAGKPPSEPWRMWVGDFPNKYGPKLRVGPKTGEFVAGPFVSGSAELRYYDPFQGHDVHVPIDLDTSQDAPLGYDIVVGKQGTGTPESGGKAGTQTAASQIATGTQAFLGMGGVMSRPTGVSHLTGKVFMSDGVTPALGAQVLYYAPDSPAPSIAAMTDALGNLEPRGIWRNDYYDPTTAADDAGPATVIGFLPGNRGAAILRTAVHPDQPLRLVLPPAISAAGRVTVGGAGPVLRPGQIRVVAAYQGQGVLNWALSLSVTPDADGRFVLAGLTPGTYHVQAALDEIWMSTVATIRVTANRNKPTDLSIQALSIPAPGAPLRIQLLEPSGKPAADRTVTIDRSGPLAYLWPQQWTSDIKGAIYIPTLEAGQHIVRVSGSDQAVTVNVPPLQSSPVEVKIALKE